VTVIPNGIDTGHFKPIPRNNALAESLESINEGNRKEASRVIGFAGELREKKGLRLLLSACAQVNKKKPATLLIVGDISADEDNQKFEEFKLSNIEARIIVTGFCENGKLVSTNNADELAKAINELLNDENLRKEFGIAACQTITDKVTPQAELNGNLVLSRHLGLKM